MKRPGLLERAQHYRHRWQTYGKLLDTTPEGAQTAWREFGRTSRLFRELNIALGGTLPLAGAALGAGLQGASWVERLVTGFGPSAVNHELYTLVRILRPQVVVETGVASGVSSAIILEALEQGGGGSLWSVDLPNYDPAGYLNADGRREQVRVPAGRRPGWLVPARLRHRWHLKLGRSDEVLERLLEEAGPVGLFFHDSEHSAATMRFEFAAAWPALAPGGVLYSDDVIWNDAFDKFCLSLGVDPTLTPTGRGAVRKTGDPERPAYVIG